MVQISRGVLQAATTLVKNTQTVMGAEIPCGGLDTITLFVEYVNGDETGVLVQARFKYVTGGTTFQDVTWSAAAGTKTATLNEYSMTATANRYISFDIKGVEYVEFTASADNTGTPTGTIAANYTMTEN